MQAGSSKGSQESEKVVGSALNALRIVRYLSQRKQPARLSDIAKELEINSSTCFNILRTLSAAGFVASADKTYTLGEETLRIAFRALGQWDDLGRINAALAEFAVAHNVTVILWRVEDGDLVSIAAANPPASMVTIRSEPGRRIPLLSGSMGRVIGSFAGLPEAKLREAFARIDWQDFDWERFQADVRATKARGFAMERSNFLRGMHALAAPVPRGDRKLERIVSVFALAHDLPEARMEDLGLELMQFARALAPRNA